MKNIAIFGAGGLGREIACLINQINKHNPTWKLIGFFDDDNSIECNEYGKVLGGIEELNKYKEELYLAISIGSPHIIKKIKDKINNPFIKFPNLISPDVVFLDRDNISLGEGNIICSSCFISCKVKIGNFNIFNCLNSIGHDTTIGDFNTFMPSVNISGCVNIGDCNFFGVSSTVLQKIQIGTSTIIGANSLILRKTKDNNTYVGSPAYILKI